MEQKQKAIEEFLNNLAKLPKPSSNPSVFEALIGLKMISALAEKVFEAGYRAGLTEKTINDLSK